MCELISTDDLEKVCGGNSAWDSFVKEERAAVAAPYKDIVCSGAGIKGGPQFAQQVYGPNRTTPQDMIRAAKSLRSVCIGARRLPEAAPPSPF